jgi:3-isopropylmalate/(R)-2-methylmalate dehydratase small subunit
VEPFKTVRGRVVAIDRANIDTDQIIPKQFLKSIRRTGFGDALFHDWRALPDGSPDPAFPLNQERFRGAAVLVARNNFGCGSSREHAVWAVVQAGFRAVIAPAIERDGRRLNAFADIFAGNAVKNGLLTVELAAAEVDRLFERVAAAPGVEATVDLERQQVTLHASPEQRFSFAVDPVVKDLLLRGLDEIGLTLQHAAEIARFEAAHDVQRT